MSDSGKGSGSLIIGGIVALILFCGLGYLVIMASRLFLRPTKAPPVTFCVIVGFATFFTVHLNTDWLTTDTMTPVSETNLVGYEMEIYGNKATISIPPKHNPKIDWKYMYKRNHWNSWPPIYIIGKADGKNKIFHASLNKDQIMNSKEFGEAHGENIIIMDHKDFPYTQKNYLDSTWWRVTVPIAGIICILLSHAQAFLGATNATDSRPSMG